MPDASWMVDITHGSVAAEALRNTKVATEFNWPCDAAQIGSL